MKVASPLIDNPVAVTVVPSNVRLAESPNAPEAPDYGILVLVRSDIVADDSTVSAPDTLSPPLSIAA